MLPDQPNLKREIQERLQRLVEHTSQRKLGVFSDIPKHILHEGDSLVVIRADGTNEDCQLSTASAEFEVNVDTTPEAALNERMLLLEKVSTEMARQMTRGLFESLNQSLDAAGQTIDARGRKLSGEVILEILDKIDVNFRPDGTQEELSIAIPPEMKDQLISALAELEENQELKHRHEALINKKREIWRDREASRKLVG